MQTSEPSGARADQETSASARSLRRLCDRYRPFACVVVIGLQVPVDFGSPQKPEYPPGAVVRPTASIRILAAAGVNDAGQATLSIPLRIPDGPLGMKPTLSIEYSGGGNGPLGVGMALSGLTAIAPCEKSFATYGYADGVNFERDDAYCLDGQTLVTEANIGTEVVFHTESETFQKIVARYADSDDEQPSSFDVFGRDGVRRTYEPLFGTQLESASETGVLGNATQVAVIYPIRSASDLSGNAILYNYDTGVDSLNAAEFSYRLSSIQYSFASGTTGARRWLNFRYGPRTDAIVRHAFGVQSVTRSVLLGIDAYAPNPTSTAKVWWYDFRYQASPDTKRSLLRSVQLCEQSGTCSQAKTLHWTQPLAGYYHHTISSSVEFSQKALSQDGWSYFQYKNDDQKNFFTPTDVRLLIFDADGDGIDDALYRTAATQWHIDQETNAEGHGYSLSASAYYSKGQISFRKSAQKAPLSSLTDVTSVLEPHFWVAHLGKSRVADLGPHDAPDGTPDLLLARTRVDLDGEWSSPDETIKNYHHWRYGYTRFYGYPWSPTTPVYFDQTAVFGPIFRGLFFMDQSAYVRIHFFDPPFQHTVADLNGDGRMDEIDAIKDVDLLNYVDQDWDELKSYNNPWPYYGSIAPDATPAPFPHDWTCGNGYMRISDLNGDGREDILATRDDIVLSESESADLGVYRRLHLDDHGIPQADEYGNVWGGDCGEDVPDLVTADLNGDGLDDVLYPPQSLNGNPEPLVRWNTGKGFGPLMNMPVHQGGVPNAELNTWMYQRVPTGKDTLPVPWDQGTRVADVNQDGREDIVAFRLDPQGVCGDANVYLCTALKTRVILYLSLGDRFEASLIQHWNGASASLAHGLTVSQVGDVTGDGAIDLIGVIGGKITVVELPWREQPDKLLSVWDEGVFYPLELFQYSRAWWGDGVKPDATDCGYPTSCMGRGSTVVRAHGSFTGTRADGSAMYRERIHKYTNPRSDLTGRGFLGFGAHHVWDVDLGQETVTEFDNRTRQDLNGTAPGGVFYPFAGLARSVTTVTPVANLPTDADLNSASLMPGLTDAVAVARVTKLTRKYTVTPRMNGRVILVQPESYESREFETQALADASTNSRPGYVWWNMDAEPLRVRSGTIEYDDYGNVKKSEARTEGGVRRTTYASVRVSRGGLAHQPADGGADPILYDRRTGAAGPRRPNRVRR